VKKKRCILNKRILLALLAVFLLAAAAFAADWYPVSFRYSWNSRAFGFCPQESQCLVSPAGSHSFDGMPEKYFSPTKPYCINSSQYILDFYCANGNWSSRTRLIAVELLKIAESRANNDFSLFCGPVDIAVNNVNYPVNGISVKEFLNNYCHPFSSTGTHPCVNSVCVLKYGADIAFGVSLNIPVDDNGRSFLEVLGKDDDACNSAKNLDSDFDLCRDNIWYNHNTESILVLPSSVSPVSSSAAGLVDRYFSRPFDSIRSFAASQANASFLGSSNLFSNVYFAREAGREIFGFLEKDKSLFSYDYFGILMNGIDFSGYSLCTDIMSIADGRALCRDSPNAVFVAKKTPDVNQSLVNAWSDVTSKLRLR
jgi:hypothetical protein